MDGIELASFEIISSVGAARSSIMEAMQFARQGQFKRAYEKIDEANAYLSDGHKKHVELIQKESSGDQITVTILFMHAEDQFMTTYSLRDVTYEMIAIWEELKSEERSRVK
ncbi:PTS lactose/cellobiose transporter subunit IIA [Listeria fleischmannii]|uniref:Oligo-beta-mannoside-specific phosphotransferase enzyme IIA component n=2 Tax=Listeria fleischmannii TaxID=1069827 RepID=W7D8E0_9LIST|nr:PTS lactose/cellobiose transporter subunit IIA [Listeria fleischmannii]EIA21002.1 cellobiose PTS enzyme IIA [Listeria fleischmannii subsp. coloradonensis]EUJ48851.1 Oligo-beta-mannoside-specific phosphotransferase enzyme IIA component [Listeria fleischmannii FSL S10-1203]MBC1398975.1 PTS lactose/cellobiose transporter subunit IIA [Listeria fleischmannii]MBC1419696.1 PTS lactose/cellobiose transporter subunit IIA [Listeria fleischmannii]MBC1427228.1 PTS lactose/cellobiose transporter subunit